VVISLIKQIISKERDMTIYSIYKRNRPVTSSKQVVNVIDLGYLGVGKDFLEQLSALQFKKKRNLDLSKDEKHITKFILKRG
jgi:hypothetical protein